MFDDDQSQLDALLREIQSQQPDLDALFREMESQQPQLDALLRDLQTSDESLAAMLAAIADESEILDLDESVLATPAESEPPVVDPNATATDVAGWMQSQVDAHGVLEQAHAARSILRQFGDRFLYRNRNRNWAISLPVLGEFFAKTRASVVWVRPQRYWRKRRPGDPPSRQVEVE